MPRGVVVLPGLDTSFTSDRHDRMITGETTQGHPQYGLMKLLRSLEAGVGEVVELGGETPRTALVQASLAPASETPAWPMLRADIPVSRALEGVSILAARNADVEARAIALAARATLAEGKTVGIVARDQTLARRISAELNRHGVVVDDAAGTPLFQSAAGRLARQVLAVATDDYAPVDIISLLRNAAVSLGLDRFIVRKLTDHLDLRFRSERPGSGIAGLRGLSDREELPQLLDRLEAAMAPIVALKPRERITAPELASALLMTLEALIAEADLPGMTELRRWATELVALDQGGTAFAPFDLEAVLEALLTGTKTQNPVPARDDIHIWGELEARLMNPDLMILAGMNEDIWPPVADPGPWLSRGMRIGIGLEPPERRQGQAAHDFVMAVGNAEVIIAYAERIGTSPALPSPLLQRLYAFIGEAEAKVLRARGARWLAQADAIDHAGVPRPAERPAPNPPSAAPVDHRDRAIDALALRYLRPACAGAEADRTARHRTQRP